MCSWPPEDDRIESFHRHVRDQAKAIIGADLARTEKFTTSVRDGIDIRETLRNWHTGDLYVKVVPPSRGSIEVVVFLFDVPADPEVYTNRTTWYAEHAEESTLAFYATDPDEEPGRPGDRPGRVRRCAVPLPAPADPRRLDRPAARLHRHPGGAAARRGVPAQPGPARRRRQPQDPAGVAGGGWPAGSAARSSTCRSSGSAASSSSGCARSTSSTASRCGRTRRISSGTCDPRRRPDDDFDLSCILLPVDGRRQTRVPDLPPTEPFEAPKYGVATRIPKAWPIAVHEEEDRIFVAIIPQEDFDRPGVAACELALAPESLDDYRTRIDTNAKRERPAERQARVEPGHQGRPRRAARDHLGVPSRRRAASGAR